MAAYSVSILNTSYRNVALTMAATVLGTPSVRPSISLPNDTDARIATSGTHNGTHTLSPVTPALLSLRDIDSFIRPTSTRVHS